LNRVIAAALELQSFCRQRQWRFCFIGGVAVQRWGEPRVTRDVDLTLLTGFGPERDFVRTLLGVFKARIADAEKFALSSRVLLLESSEGVEIDLGLGALPFEERLIERASDFDIGSGRVLTTCSAEDLVVLKTFAGRDRDWADIVEILAAQSGKLDMALIFRELDPLLDLKEDTSARDRLRALLSAT
jgi:hypothetical protein